MTDSQGDARGYSWASFTPGHEVSLKHGAYSPRLVKARAEALIQEVLADPENSHLHAPRYRPQLQLWAEVQAQAELLREHLDGLEIEEQLASPRGGTKSRLEQWVQIVGRASSLAEKMTLTPTSHARFTKDVASTATMSALGARHPLRAALERISEERQAIEATVVEQPATDELGVDDAS